MKYLVVFMLLLLTSCELLNGPEEEKVPQRQVHYKVTGTAKTVDITIENANGGTSQFGDQQVPWAHRFFELKEPGTWLYISAQNQTDRGSVIVQIVVDGQVFKESKSEGGYVIASASGILE